MQRRSEINRGATGSTLSSFSFSLPLPLLLSALPSFPPCLSPTLTAREMQIAGILERRKLPNEIWVRSASQLCFRYENPIQSIFSARVQANEDSHAIDSYARVAHASSLQSTAGGPASAVRSFVRVFPCVADRSYHARRSHLAAPDDHWPPPLLRDSTFVPRKQQAWASATAATRSYPGEVAIRYELPVLCTTP